MSSRESARSLAQLAMPLEAEEQAPAPAEAVHSVRARAQRKQKPSGATAAPPVDFDGQLRGNVERMEAALGLPPTAWPEQPSPLHVETRLKAIQTATEETSKGAAATSLVGAAVAAAHAWAAAPAGATPAAASLLAAEEAAPAAEAVHSMQARARRKQSLEGARSRQKAATLPASPAAPPAPLHRPVWLPVASWAAGRWEPAGWTAPTAPDAAPAASVGDK
jgi:hypothetical protein